MHDLYCCLLPWCEALRTMLLGISDRNKMVLWPGCGGRAEFSLHTENVRSVWFVVRRGWCCNLCSGVALIVWFTTNGMCMKNNTITYVARASNSKRDCDTWSLLLLAATVRSYAHSTTSVPTRFYSSSCVHHKALTCAPAKQLFTTHEHNLMVINKMPAISSSLFDQTLNWTSQQSSQCLTSVPRWSST